MGGNPKINLAYYLGIGKNCAKGARDGLYFMLQCVCVMWTDAMTRFSRGRSSVLFSAPLQLSYVSHTPGEEDAW